MRISPLHLLVLAAALAAMMDTATAARNTRRPKHPNPKRPLGAPMRVERILTTTTTSMPTSTGIEETTGFLDTFSLSPTGSTTFPGDAFPYHNDTTALPGGPQGNYTLEYNECFFNACECCSPDRGPLGLMGQMSLNPDEINPTPPKIPRPDTDTHPSFSNAIKVPFAIVTGDVHTPNRHLTVYSL